MDALAEASQKMLALGERALTFKPRSLGAATADYYDQVCAASQSGEKMAVIPTGFQELDNILEGIMGGKLVIIAGRPGTGKTSFLLSMARNISLADTQKKRRILIFSLEMDEMELTERFLAQQTRISGQNLRTALCACRRKILEREAGYFGVLEQRSFFQRLVQAVFWQRHAQFYLADGHRLARKTIEGGRPESTGPTGNGHYPGRRPIVCPGDRFRPG